MDTPKLIFGDPESIKFRDEHFYQTLEKKLLDKVKCPFCKAKATCSYHCDKEQKIIGWNFDCEDDCPNSFEYAEKHGIEGCSSKTFTDFNGRFVNY